MRSKKGRKVRFGDMLSLRIKNNMEELKSLVPRPALGVPENALPGWVDVPLYDKLPMLDCPGNAIVFTGGKMGKVQRFEGSYDTNCNNEASEYNALIDPHLTTFYMRKRNLEHLKKIGKITENNDVICNALQFNEYRRNLNRYHLFAIYKELKRREQERDDRANIQHAETIVHQDRKKSGDDQSSNVPQAKLLFEQKKHEKNVANYQKIEEKIERIKKLNELKLIILQQKKILHNIAIEQHQLARSDLLRMRIIAVKRQNRIRTERSRIHIKNYYDNTKQTKMERAQIKWQKQLSERKKKHERNVKLIAASAHKKAINVEKRKKLSQKRWQHIMSQIALKSENIKRKRGGKKIIIQKLEKILKSSLKNGESSMELVTRKDISEAVDTALSFNTRKKCNPDLDSSSIYDTAKYIIENILFMINEDLSCNKQLLDYVCCQIDDYFTNGKDGITKKVSIIIRQIDNTLQSQQKIITSGDHRISFNKKEIIGDSAMQENLALVLKSVRSRTPTPAGSLTSLLGIMKYEFLEDVKTLEQPQNQTYTKEEMIFAEHFLIKFKRLFIVGVERKVFEAIKLYQKGKLYSFNRKLLKIDREYLINVMAKSILAYNVNRYDFEGNLRLCISAASSDIIWDLQNNYMRQFSSTIDPKSIRYPKSRCICGTGHTQCLN